MATLKEEAKKLQDLMRKQIDDEIVAKLVLASVKANPPPDELDEFNALVGTTAHTRLKAIDPSPPSSSKITSRRKYPIPEYTVEYAGEVASTSR